MLTHFPHGISSFGIPVIGAGPILTTGNVYFVSSTSPLADDSPRHGSKERPFRTIDYAVGRCGGNQGDHILVMPGHIETISAAGGLALDVAGITVMGIGYGGARPKIQLGTTTDADIDIDADNVTLLNLIMQGNLANVSVGLDVNAAHCSVLGCRFEEAGGNLNVLAWIQPTGAASSNLTVQHCTAVCPDAQNTRFVNFSGASDGNIITDNILLGDWGTAAIGGAGAVTNTAILRNYIYNAATDADSCIAMAATATGIMADNRAAGGHASQGIVPGDLGALENYYELSTSDLSGILEPASS